VIHVHTLKWIICILGVYVDDIQLTSENNEILNTNELLKQISKLLIEILIIL